MWLTAPFSPLAVALQDPSAPPLHGGGRYNRASIHSPLSLTTVGACMDKFSLQVADRPL
jgi:hypothetical protein